MLLLLFYFEKGSSSWNPSNYVMNVRAPEWLGCSAEHFVSHENGGFWSFTLRRAQQSNVRGRWRGSESGERYFIQKARGPLETEE